MKRLIKMMMMMMMVVEMMTKVLMRTVMTTRVMGNRRCQPLPWTVYRARPCARSFAQVISPNLSIVPPHCADQDPESRDAQ